MTREQRAWEKYVAQTKTPVHDWDDLTGGQQLHYLSQVDDDDAPVTRGDLRRLAEQLRSEASDLGDPEYEITSADAAREAIAASIEKLLQ